MGPDVEPNYGVKKFFITLGQGHIHRVNGKIYDKDCLVVVYAEDEGSARQRVFEVFGDKWAFSYAEHQVDSRMRGFFPRGEIEL